MAGARQVRDDLGNVISLSRPAQRIVVLSPHATELVFAAGAGERIVGTVEFSDWPAAARGILRVGDAANVDPERILALKPDLVVLWGSGPGARYRERFMRAGAAVFVSEPKHFEDVPDTLRRIGTLTGTEVAADTAAQEFNDRLGALKRRPARAPRSVFYEVWPRPLMTLGGDQIVSAALRLCGGRNVFGEIRQMAASVDIEAVMARDPEVILVAAPVAEAESWLAEWKAWPGIRAVQRRQLFAVPPDELGRPGPRLVDGAERLCAILDGARPGANGPGR